MGKENLIPFNELTQEEQRKIASDGGKASVVARAKKRDLKQRIAATWELATEMKRKGFIREIKDLIQNSTPENDVKIELLRDKIKVLGVGGAEMLTLMEIIDNEKVSPLARVTAIQNLLEHEFGKSQSNDTLKVEWASGIGKSPAFSDDSILLGIQHGLAKLSVIDLDKVSAMIDVERESRVIVIEESTE